MSALIYPAMPIFAFILYFNGRAMEEVHNEEGYKEGDDSNEQNVRIEDLYSKPLPENEDDGPQNT